VWLSRRNTARWNTKFFRIIFRYDNLANYFQTNFSLMQHHKYTLNDLEKMMPWERSLYVNMLIRHVEEENERLKQQMLNNRRK
jgi:hypothetical protein